MKIALIGYGKMGKAIEEIALERGHQIVLKCNSELPVEKADFSNVDVAIEFTKPDLAVHHIEFCLNNNISLVVGTTGWNEKLNDVTALTNQTNGALLYASNFSIGVNIFFELNKKLAQLMKGHAEYTPHMEEIHHLQKLDAPSGTAISLANDMLDHNQDYIAWVHAREEKPYTNSKQIAITSLRQPDVPGTHTIQYTSAIDSITITHEAHNRKGFASGSVIAAEWLFGKKGIFTMNDVLNF